MSAILFALVLLAQDAAATPGPAVAGRGYSASPSGDDIARYYPEGAAKRGLHGKAIMQCEVEPADATVRACRVVFEAPRGEGFGETAIRLAPLFKMKPPAPGQDQPRETRIPLRFVLPGDQGPGQAFDLAQACYGQVANLAEADPSNRSAWQAALNWSTRIAVYLGSHGVKPSGYPALLADLQSGYASGLLIPPAAADLKTCLKAPT